MKKLALCLVLLSLCSLTFAGCAEKKAKPKTTTPTTGAPAADETTPPAADKDKPADPAAPAAEPAK